MLVIEIIESCNFKCHFCSAKSVNTPKFMPLEMFKRIILEAKDMGISDIDLIPSKGEPFLHPDIYEMLSFLNDNMKHTIVFTNGTAINVNRLKKVRMDNINLCISHYGETYERFNELTGMGEEMFQKFNRKISEMSTSGIKFNIEHRGYGYEFSFPDNKNQNQAVFDPTLKCHFHSMPKILVNGDVVFCKFVKDNVGDSEAVVFANVNDGGLRSALENPLRYKFFDSQSICAKYCSSFSKKCYKETLVSFKIMSASKKIYNESRELVDSKYKEIEDAIIQRNKQ